MAMTRSAQFGRGTMIVLVSTIAGAATWAVDDASGIRDISELANMAQQTRPFLSLNMETGTNPRPGGEPVGSSLREVAVLASWDRISSGIRAQPWARADVRTRVPTVAARGGGRANR